MIKNSRTSLFLMELILSVLLFSVTSAVCVRLFVQTHLREKQSQALLFALTESQNLSAHLRTVNGTTANEVTKELSNRLSYSVLMTGKELPSTSENAEKLIIFYDKDFQACPASTDAAYRMTMILTDTNGLLDVELRFDEINRLEQEKEQLYHYDEQALIRSVRLLHYQDGSEYGAEQEAQ